MTTMVEDSIYVQEGRECNRIDAETGKICGQNLKSQMIRGGSHAPDGLSLECKLHKARRDRLMRAAYAARTPEEILAAQLRLYPDRLKPCPRCEEKLPFSAFRGNVTRPSGLHDECRDCEIAHNLLRPRLEQRMATLGISTKVCIYCGSAKRVSIEHIFSGAAGRAVVENMVYACVNCNSSKNDDNVYDWLAWRKPKNPHPLLGWLIQQAELVLAPPS